MFDFHFTNKDAYYYYTLSQAPPGEEFRAATPAAEIHGFTNGLRGTLLAISLAVIVPRRLH